MANARLIYRDLFTSADMMGLPAPARLLFVGMIVHADDSGEIRHNILFFTRTLLAGLAIRPCRAHKWLDMLRSRGCIKIVFYADRERTCIGTERTLSGPVADWSGTSSDLERYASGNGGVVSCWKITNFSRFQRLKRREGKRSEGKGREDEEPPFPLSGGNVAAQEEKSKNGTGSTYRAHERRADEARSKASLEQAKQSLAELNARLATAAKPEEVSDLVKARRKK